MKSWQVIHDDFRAALPSIAAEVLITDPVWPNCPPGAIEGHDRPHDLFAEMVAAMPQTITRAVIVMRSDSDPAMLAPMSARLPFKQMCWLRYAMPSYLGRVLGGNEVAYCYGEHIPVERGRRVVPSIGPVAQPGDRPRNGHPMSRALVHFKWLVDWWSLPGETIVDPYCGSATTGVAALTLGRHFVGIETDARWVPIARNRLADSERQGDMLVNAGDAP